MTVRARTVGCPLYSDAQLEHWADRYVRGGFRVRGITLLQFLADPGRYEQQRPQVDDRPALERRAAARARRALGALHLEHLREHAR